jgi:group I intron endonuclease
MEKNKVYGRIYLITNLINNKKYIGQTINSIEKRFSEHCSRAKNKKYSNTAIIHAINKYGKENFTIEQIDIAYSQKELNILEGVYISWFKSLAPYGYNLTNIINGKGSFKPSKETIEKLKKYAQTNEAKLKSCNNGKRGRKSITGSKSKYCGIIKRKNSWIAQIRKNNKKTYIGSYLLEEDAAKACDIEAIKIFGNDTFLNFPELKEDYIKGNIIVPKSSHNNHSSSTVSKIHKHGNKWIVRYNNRKNSKTFTNIEDAVIFIEYLNYLETVNV